MLLGLVLLGNSDPDFDGQTLEVQHVTADSTACLDVKWGNASDGQDVWTWDCNDTDAQKWTFEKRTAGAYTGIRTGWSASWATTAWTTEATSPPATAWASGVALLTPTARRPTSR